MQRLVGLDPAAAVAVAETVGLGIDDAALDIEQIVVALVTAAGDDAGVRQLAVFGIAQGHAGLRL